MPKRGIKRKPKSDPEQSVKTSLDHSLFGLLNNMNISEYLFFSEFVKFRRSCKHTLCMHRISSCYNIIIGKRPWSDLAHFLPPKCKILPFLELNCRNMEENKFFTDYPSSDYFVKHLKINFFMPKNKRFTTPEWNHLPKGTERLTTVDVKIEDIIRWMNTDPLIEYHTIFTKPQYDWQYIRTHVKKWICSASKTMPAIFISPEGKIETLVLDCPYQDGDWLLKTEHVVFNMSQNDVSKHLSKINQPTIIQSITFQHPKNYLAHWHIKEECFPQLKTIYVQYDSGELKTFPFAAFINFYPK